jgi:bis(5'-nucleosyl)-tetraphosphatase (symmetrical)
MPWQNAGMKYLVGDLQGCGEALDRLLVTLGFSPSRDHACFLGDLVNRGPASLATLRRLQGLGSSATCLLGNHDLHLLAVAQGVRPAKRGDTLNDILSAPDRSALIDWIRHQRMAVHEQGWLMVHAGVVPQWDLTETLRLAGEVERHLRSPSLRMC